MTLCTQNNLQLINKEACRVAKIIDTALTCTHAVTCMGAQIYSLSTHAAACKKSSVIPKLGLLHQMRATSANMWQNEARANSLSDLFEFQSLTA